MNKEIIASRLIELRIKKNLTQNDVAKALGISPSSVAMYETGDRIPRDEVKIKIAKLYGKSVTSIFYA